MNILHGDMCIVMQWFLMTRDVIAGLVQIFPLYIKVFLFHWWNSFTLIEIFCISIFHRRDPYFLMRYCYRRFYILYHSSKLKWHRYLKSSTWKSMVRQFYKVNSKASDDLATQGVGTSVAKTLSSCLGILCSQHLKATAEYCSLGISSQRDNTRRSRS